MKNLKVNISLLIYYPFFFSFDRTNKHRLASLSYIYILDLDPTITKPALMILTDELPLPPAMIKIMEESVPNIEIHTIKNTSHWVLWDKPEESNEYLKQWLSKIYPA